MAYYAITTFQSGGKVRFSLMGKTDGTGYATESNARKAAFKIYPNGNTVVCQFSDYFAAQDYFRNAFINQA